MSAALRKQVAVLYDSADEVPKVKAALAGIAAAGEANGAAAPVLASMLHLGFATETKLISGGIGRKIMTSDEVKESDYGRQAAKALLALGPDGRKALRVAFRSKHHLARTHALEAYLQYADISDAAAELTPLFHDPLRGTAIHGKARLPSIRKAQKELAELVEKAVERLPVAALREPIHKWFGDAKLWARTLELCKSLPNGEGIPLLVTELKGAVASRQNRLAQLISFSLGKMGSEGAKALIAEWTDRPSELDRHVLPNVAEAAEDEAVRLILQCITQNRSAHYAATAFATLPLEKQVAAYTALFKSVKTPPPGLVPFWRTIGMTRSGPSDADLRAAFIVWRGYPKTGAGGSARKLIEDAEAKGKKLPFNEAEKALLNKGKEDQARQLIQTIEKAGRGSRGRIRRARSLDQLAATNTAVALQYLAREAFQGKGDCARALFKLDRPDAVEVWARLAKAEDKRLRKLTGRRPSADSRASAIRRIGAVKAPKSLIALNWLVLGKDSVLRPDPKAPRRNPSLAKLTALAYEAIGDPKGIEPCILLMGKLPAAEVHAFARAARTLSGVDHRDDVAAWQAWLNEQKGKPAE